MKSAKPSVRARPLADLLAAPGGPGALLCAARQLSRLERSLHALLSAPLANQVRLAPGRESAVVLLVSNNALAARLRQQAPTLLEGLRQQGWPVESLRIRVSLESGAAEPLPGKGAQMSAQGLTSLTKLRNELPASPLRDALDRLVTHHQEEEKAPGRQADPPKT